eukprot:TRINITY_DN7646_c0_g1_i3.p1 TRINITY_DN7646_c0_g1~~TRINITY_DN7646_c0_g1_i3.p1  ORF type:complete len:129 (+),score=6.01 TRINITY_DN7646_c0_g1_i3:114-500(+)
MEYYCRMPHNTTHYTHKNHCTHQNHNTNSIHHAEMALSAYRDAARGGRAAIVHHNATNSCNVRCMQCTIYAMYNTCNAQYAKYNVAMYNVAMYKYMQCTICDAQYRHHRTYALEPTRPLTMPSGAGGQ